MKDFAGKGYDTGKKTFKLWTNKDTKNLKKSITQPSNIQIALLIGFGAGCLFGMGFIFGAKGLLCIFGAA